MHAFTQSTLSALVEISVTSANRFRKNAPEKFILTLQLYYSQPFNPLEGVVARCRDGETVSMG